MKNDETKGSQRGGLEGPPQLALSTASWLNSQDLKISKHLNPGGWNKLNLELQKNRKSEKPALNQV